MCVQILKASDVSCVTNDSFDNFATGRFEFFVCVTRCKKHLKRENVPLFKLLLEMKFTLTCQTSFCKQIACTCMLCQ